MGKTWVWLVILVIVVIVVVVLASRGGKGKEKPKTGEEAAATGNVPSMLFAGMEKTLQSATDSYSRGRIMGDIRTMPLKDKGWVAAVEPTKTGGLTVSISMKAPEAGGGEPQVIADVPKENVPKEQLAKGQPVTYFGYITQIETDPQLVVHLESTVITPGKK